MAAALILLTIFGRIPGASRLSEELQNGAHAPVFCVLSIIVFNLVRFASFRRTLTVGLCIVIGGGIEFAQYFLGGDASSVDLLHDVLGACIGMAIVSDARTVFGRRAMVAVAAAGGVLAFAPLLWCLTAYVNRNAKFPVLAQFRHSIDEYFIDEPTSGVAIQALPPVFHAPVGAVALKVRLPEVEWPGVDLGATVPDWTGYRQLCVDLGNPSSIPLPLHLRVHDAAHNGKMDDRFNYDFVIDPMSLQTRCVPLSAIRSAPRTRPLDMRDVDRIIIFGDAAVAGRILFVQKVWLE